MPTEQDSFTSLGVWKIFQQATPLLLSRRIMPPGHRGRALSCYSREVLRNWI